MDLFNNYKKIFIDNIYCEKQVQCNMNYFWSREEVLSKLNYAMSKAFHAVYDLSKERNVYMRDAAYIISIERVVNAVKSRGWI